VRDSVHDGYLSGFVPFGMGPPDPMSQYALKTRAVSIGAAIDVACMLNRPHSRIETSTEAEAPCQRALPGKTGSPGCGDSLVV